MLAKRQLHNREVLWEASRRQSTGLTNRNLIRLYLWIRSHTSLKSNTCTGINAVDEAGISVKVNAHYPGRSQGLQFFFPLLWQRCHEMDFEKSAEGTVASLLRQE